MTQLGPVSESPGVSSGTKGLKIISAFVVSSRTTEVELISGKLSMCEGPRSRDLPFGQMVFPEMCQLLYAAAVATATEIQKQPGPWG